MSRRFISFIKKAKRHEPRYLIWRVYDLFKKKIFRFVYLVEGTRLFSHDIMAHINKISKRGISDYLKNRNNFKFFFDHGTANKIWIQGHLDGQHKKRVIEKAERIIKNHIFILGKGEHYLGDKIDWHKDYRSGLRREKKYTFSYDLLNWSKPSDVRIIWDLNRLYFLVDLGKGYLLTGDEKYTKKYKDLFLDWVRNNPVGFSVSWGCAMEASIRSVNLIWALMLFIQSELLDDVFLEIYFNQLIHHGHFIRRHMEYRDIRGNHYLADLVGLIYISLFLPEYKKSKGWLLYAASRLDREIIHQLYEDGVDHEGSIPYHQLVVEMCLSSLLLLNKNGIHISDNAMTRIEKALEFTMAYTKPDGMCPIIGDTDDGRLHILGDQDINDHRHLLSTGAVVFSRGDFKVASSRFWEESVWLLGEKGIMKYNGIRELQNTTSVAFSKGGYYIMKEGLDYLLIDCGDVGMRGTGGHGHHDLLSFELVLNGDNLICDSGCSSYTADRKERMDVLRADAHNTVVVDGMDFGSISDVGFIQAGPIPYRKISWKSNRDKDEFVGENFAYSNYPSKIIHKRSISLFKKESKVTISDELSGIGVHEIKFYFHFDPDCLLQKIQGLSYLTIVCSKSGNRYILVSPENGNWEIKGYLHFSRYAKSSPAKVAIFDMEKVLPCEAKFTFSLLRQQEN